VQPDALPGTKSGDLMAVHAHVAELLGRRNPWNHEPGTEWLAGWLRAEVEHAAPGLLG
jgi:hypothetical protein